MLHIWYWSAWFYLHILVPWGWSLLHIPVCTFQFCAADASKRGRGSFKANIPWRSKCSPSWNSFSGWNLITKTPSDLLQAMIVFGDFADFTYPAIWRYSFSMQLYASSCLWSCSPHIFWSQMPTVSVPIWGTPCNPKDRHPRFPTGNHQVLPNILHKASIDLHEHQRINMIIGCFP